MIYASSLTARLLSVKGTHFLNAQLGIRPSFSWWSICMSRPSWKLENNGLFTTKSAYKFLKHSMDHQVGELTDKRHPISFRNRIWKLVVPPKVKIFVWCLFHNLLPSSSNISHKRCQVQLSLYNLRLWRGKLQCTLSCTAFGKRTELSQALLRINV